MVPFAANDDLAATPVDVIEFHASHFTGSQPKPH